MKIEIPAALKADVPLTLWGRILNATPVVMTVIATLLAFISGYFAIAFLLRFVRTHNFSVFVIYRVAVGVLMLVLLATGAVS